MFFFSFFFFFFSLVELPRFLNHRRSGLSASLEMLEDSTARGLHDDSWQEGEAAGPDPPSLLSPQVHPMGWGTPICGCYVTCVNK